MRTNASRGESAGGGGTGGGGTSSGGGGAGEGDGAGQGASSGNTPGLLALVLGIAALPLVFCYLLGLAAGVAAIGLGAIGVRNYSRGTATNAGQATIGLACGVIATLAVLVIIILPN